MKVFIYWNLHRHCWSIKALDGERRGRVIAHASRADMVGVTFKVSEAGRQRVIRERRKNVHAGVVGHLAGLWGQPVDSVADELLTLALGKADSGIYGDRIADMVSPIAPYERVSYNPYKAGHFYRVDGEQPIESARWASLAARSVYVAKGA